MINNCLLNLLLDKKQEHNTNEQATVIHHV